MTSVPNSAWRAGLLLLCLTAGRACAQSVTENDLERYAAQGQAALAAEDYPHAQAAYEKLRELSPGVAEVYGTLGIIYFKEHKYEQAVSALQQAIRLKPSLPGTDALLALSLSELGRFNQALPGLEKGFRRSADPAVKRMCGLQLERTLTVLHQDSSAVELALELNRLYPGDPEVLYHTGQVFGNYAFLTMQKLAEVAPDSIWRHQAAAEADESQGLTGAAIDEYRKVLSLDPNRPGIHYRLGRTLLARSRETHSAEDTAQALQEFQQELQLHPENANAAYEIGEMHRQSGELDQARTYFERALALYPDFEEAHLGLADVLTAQRQTSAALPHLEKATALDPQDEVAWYRLSLAEREMGDSAAQQKALTEFKRLHAQILRQQGVGREPAAPSEVTRQQLDPAASQSN